ncbi:hypothetical protein [Alienimonas californiensis]|uniref:Uncharacterized protein n=1 Tax=Alienimonas californiensis TaxID=2527989 RepID=A0A517PAV3_9PLAN|nr:hypothetical protein [Alienimonas californiensis]QDT16497.1 hypothetical protein CA12_26010 [Alienimonas californiensis]
MPAAKSRRTLFVCGILVAAVALAGWAWHWANEQARRAGANWDARRNYAEAVFKHYQGHSLWKDNAALRDRYGHPPGGGSGSASGRWERLGTWHLQGHSDLMVRSDDPRLPTEIVKTWAEICREMELFVGPQASHAADGTALLASQEGWVELCALWLEDDPRNYGDPSDPSFLRMLRIDYDVCLDPSRPPTAAQDRDRLTWVTWTGDSRR